MRNAYVNDVYIYAENKFALYIHYVLVVHSNLTENTIAAPGRKQLPNSSQYCLYAESTLALYIHFVLVLHMYFIMSIFAAPKTK